MLKNLRKKRKSKGFTLIELVIVLAVLAIIALIAIPNFNKVREDSKAKADASTCDTIARVTEMAITDQDMVVKANVELTITAPTTAGASASVSVTKGTVGTDLIWKKEGSTEVGESNYEMNLNKIKPAQQKGKSVYYVSINGTTEAITVTTTQPATPATPPAP